MTTPPQPDPDEANGKPIAAEDNRAARRRQLEKPSTPSPSPSPANEPPAGRSEGTLSAAQPSHIQPSEPRRRKSMAADAAQEFLKPEVITELVNKALQEYQTRQDRELKKQLQQAEIDMRKAEFEAGQAKWQAEFDTAKAKWQAEFDSARAKWQADLDTAQAKSAAQREVNNERWRATVQAETFSDKIRSGVLVAVVLAVVATPIIAMVKPVPPVEFIQYVAPITAITGTVLGYWFGRQDSGSKRKSTEPLAVVC